MKKIVMKMEDLNVETFHTSPTERSHRGTVQAHDSDTFFLPCETGTCRTCDLYCMREPISKGC